ncbi:MAG: hypothetical protein M3228_03025 [Actinomycetota bacterium]|nr:hypothetical protein [Actinomycetota bacterium]
MGDRSSALDASFLDAEFRRPRSGFDYKRVGALIEESLEELVTTVPGR